LEQEKGNHRASQQEISQLKDLLQLEQHKNRKIQEKVASVQLSNLDLFNSLVKLQNKTTNPSEYQISTNVEKDKNAKKEMIKPTKEEIKPEIVKEVEQGSQDILISSPTEHAQIQTPEESFSQLEKQLDSLEQHTPSDRISLLEKHFVKAWKVLLKAREQKTHDFEISSGESASQN
jgi:hypothetical protein